MVTNSGAPAQPSLPRRIADEMGEYAAALRCEQSSVPVLLRRICQVLGISVRRDRQVPSGKAYLAWDRRTQAAPTILLPLKAHDRWDRFCAAHELGHYFLVSKYEWIPTGSKAYWQTEVLCDHFARKLLLPEDQLFEWLGDTTDAAAYLTKCDRIAGTAIAPWKEVATSISEAFPVIFFGIEPSERAGGLRVASSSLPKRAGNKAEFPSNSAIVRRLMATSKEAASRRTVQDTKLDIAVFRGTKLYEPLAKLRVSELTARAWPAAGRMKIAATTPAA
jgi:hypothetical protein